jgi:hypothetical protein
MKKSKDRKAYEALRDKDAPLHLQVYVSKLVKMQMEKLIKNKELNKIENISLWSILKNSVLLHSQSSRFIIIMTGIILGFIGALIKGFWDPYPYTIFISILSGSAGIAYTVKTLEPGARERRNGKNGNGNINYCDNCEKEIPRGVFYCDDCSTGM